MHKFPRLILKAGEGRRVEQGHLWVFSNEVAQLEDVGDNDEVGVFSAKGKFLGNALLSPSAQLRARIYSRKSEHCDKDFIKRQLSLALEYRKKIGYFRHSYRLCFSESDFLPGLVVDIYGNRLVIQLSTKSMDTRREMIVDVLRELMLPDCIYERSNVPLREMEGLPQVTGLLYGKLHSPAEVIENNLFLLTDIVNGQKTGFFLDQVENRMRLMPFVKGKRVLDLFCYIGAWSLISVANGADSAVGVDTSEPAILLAQESAQRNSLSSKCQFIKEDAFEFLKRVHNQGKYFDFIIVDPPPLARRKKDVKNALKAYRDINLRAIRVLSPGGILATASCSYHISTEEFLQILRFSAKDANADMKLIFSGGQSPDHPVHLSTPETAYLKFFAFIKV